jgi:hypothetical protein
MPDTLAGAPGTTFDFFSGLLDLGFRSSPSPVFRDGVQNSIRDRSSTAEETLLVQNTHSSLSTKPGPGTQSRLLSQRKAATTESFLTAKALVGQIKQYPRMLTESKRLPPFIYPRCATGNNSASGCCSEGKHLCLPEILAVCVSLLHMFYNRTPASSRFAWETIYKHQKSLHHEVRILLRQVKSPLSQDGF